MAAEPITRATCAHCGRGFRPSKHQVRSVRKGRPVCCSQSCAGKRQAPREGKKPIPCSSCGKLFSHYIGAQMKRYNRGATVCCSRKCSRDILRASARDSVAPVRTPSRAPVRADFSALRLVPGYHAMSTICCPFGG